MIFRKVSDLKKEKELAVQDRMAQSRRRLDQRRASLLQESELNQIRGAKRERELAITRRAGEDAESVRGALSGRRGHWTAEKPRHQRLLPDHLLILI